MATDTPLDYEQELESFRQKLSLNSKRMEKTLNTINGLVMENGRNEEILEKNIEGKAIELQKKIGNIQDAVQSVQTDKDRAEQEKQKIKKECDQISMIISSKLHERDEMKEVLTRMEQRLEQRKQQVEFDECRQRKKTTNMEKGMLLYQTHLGLKIQRTRHNTLVFIFTQVSRMDPEKEFILELTLEENSYRLIRSQPPLPNLPELEDKLNSSNNLSACFVHLRKLFQKLEE